MPAVVNISVEMKATPPIKAAFERGSAGRRRRSDQQDQAGPGPEFPPSPFDQFLRRFYQQGPNGKPMMPQGQGQAQRMALGSGFIIDPNGYIVTNNHVVENADKVTVIFQDDSKHPAKIIGRDPRPIWRS